MPKMKTRRATAKRIRVTGTGKLVRAHASKRHILTKKSRSRKRRLGMSVVVSPADGPRLMRQLPHGV